LLLCKILVADAILTALLTTVVVSLLRSGKIRKV
jgi:hypothetical protein